MTVELTFEYPATNLQLKVLVLGWYLNVCCICLQWVRLELVSSRRFVCVSCCSVLQLLSVVLQRAAAAMWCVAAPASVAPVRNSFRWS